ncbi:ATG20 Autophagy-related protein 20 [Candida maltosa Xu316]
MATESENRDNSTIDSSKTMAYSQGHKTTEIVTDETPGASQQPTFVDDEEDNNPFSHHSQGLASLISTKTFNGKLSMKNDRKHKDNVNGDDDDDDDDSLLLYNSASNNDTNTKNKKSSTTGEVFNAVNMNFESRVTKLLKPYTKIKIQITEAGNSNEGMSNSSKKYVVYTIKLINMENSNDDILTRRRYSDFESLRDVLTKIFPLIIIPPIPPKNYFDFSVLNGLVGTNNNNNNESTPTSTASSSGGTNTTTPQSYSYINSTHLNKNKLIEHRKRLLTNFLNNCLEIKQVRSLEFFAKFLDPNANWTDEITLIQSQLPKSIYLSNPENGLKTDPIYVNLPNPSNKNTMSFFKDNKKKLTKKTNKLLNNGSTNGQETGSPNSQTQYISNTSELDEINKRIMANFIGLSNDYTKLGSTFNSFSLILSETTTSDTKKNNDNELNIIFDKIGQVFDRSYITINSLIGELETKFSEPLGEIVQYTTILHYVAKYQSRKLKQKNMLDTEIQEKKKSLDDLLKIEEESSRIENAINSQGKTKNTKYSLDTSKKDQQKQPSAAVPQPPPPAPSSSSSSSTSKFKFPSFKKITQYVSEIIDQNPEQTRKQKIVQLQQKIQVLEKCQDIMLADLSFITDEVNKNIQAFQTKQLQMIYDILLQYNRFLINWAKKNIDIWEEVREEITHI